MQNVVTIKTIYDAVVLHKPYYEKVITVSGHGIKRRANLLVPIGTKIKDIVDYLGGTREDLARIVFGGPMMGCTVSNPDAPIIKITAGILFTRINSLKIKQVLGRTLRWNNTFFVE